MSLETIFIAQKGDLKLKFSTTTLIDIAKHIAILQC